VLGLLGVGCSEVVPETDHRACTDVDELVHDRPVDDCTRADLGIKQHHRIANQGTLVYPHAW